jgi:hypothetical protein
MSGGWCDLTQQLCSGWQLDSKLAAGRVQLFLGQAAPHTKQARAVAPLLSPPHLGSGRLGIGCILIVCRSNLKAAVVAGEHAAPFCSNGKRHGRLMPTA